MSSQFYLPWVAKKLQKFRKIVKNSDKNENKNWAETHVV